MRFCKKIVSRREKGGILDPGRSQTPSGYFRRIEEGASGPSFGCQKTRAPLQAKSIGGGILTTVFRRLPASVGRSCQLLVLKNKGDGEEGDAGLCGCSSG
jgi:hypothetical protein